MRKPQKSYVSKIAPLIPDALVELTSNRGVDIAKNVGTNSIKEVISDVLCGRNPRDSTEMLTRRRLGMINAATLVFFLRGVDKSKDFLEKLPFYAAAGLSQKLQKQERWLSQWILGLTGKGVQNVLRDSSKALPRYRDLFVQANNEIAQRCEAQYGLLSGNIDLAGGLKAPLTWQMLINLFCAIGSQTLAIRGSDKSTYGKLFGKLILGTVLEILGFKFIQYPPRETTKVFWLSSILGARESDATALIRSGQAVQFDIGFIGRGNPEISKDKVSRFERELEIAGGKYYAATFIIVDRVGEKSKIIEQAKAIEGTIVQMSMSYWPKQLANELYKKFKFDHMLRKMPNSEIEAFLRNAVSDIRIDNFVAAIADLPDAISEEGEQEDD